MDPILDSVKAEILRHAACRWDEDYHIGRMPVETAGFFRYWSVRGLSPTMLRKATNELVHSQELELHPRQFGYVRMNLQDWLLKEVPVGRLPDDKTL